MSTELVLEATLLAQAVEELRALQEDDGSILPDAHPQANSIVNTVIQELTRLRDFFPHQEIYLRNLAEDFAGWSGNGYGKPDFLLSLESFKPEKAREDGVVWLIVFPMYTPNASLQVRCEMLLTEAPWPGWLSQLEQQPEYSNAGFVPMRTLASTSGYDSACAVLFPEMISIGDHKVSEATNSWGTIFCDKEASRFRDFIKNAAPQLNLSLPEPLISTISDQDSTENVFLLWDMIHDRTHMQGSMPFDPFMVRQRHPYWMYSIEELRCDVTALTEMSTLAEEASSPVGVAGPQVVLLDRMLRFPVTGNRVRNYDGLAGQIMFGAMRNSGTAVEGPDGLIISWEDVPAVMWRLRREIESLYDLGTQVTQVEHWINGWDFVSQYVKPNTSTSIPALRLSGQSLDREMILAEVSADEFPLVSFFSQYTLNG